MAMDIRPNPLRDNLPQENSGGKMPDEKKMRLIIIGIIVGVLLLVGIIWYVAGAPGASDSVKRSIGKLPTAGDRVNQGNRGGSGLSFASPDPQNNNSGTSPLSGIACPNANKRPLAVMVASDPINRPNSGLSLADVVVEMPALTSNVTRLMAVFQCNEPREIGEST